MTTYLASPGMTAPPRPGDVNDRRRNGLVALAAGTVLTCAALGIAAAPPAEAPPAASASARAATSGTVEAQAGTVTAVSPTSITVSSTDGSSRSYLVNAGTTVDCRRDGIGAVKVGDTVAVTATVTAGTANATDIVDAGAWAPVLSPTLLAASPLAPAFRGCLGQLALAPARGRV